MSNPFLRLCAPLDHVVLAPPIGLLAGLHEQVQVAWEGMTDVGGMMCTAVWCGCHLASLACSDGAFVGIVHARGAVHVLLQQ
jgi:hypothetical protein